jgi:hypothetical protein
MPPRKWTEPLVLELGASHRSKDPQVAVEDYARRLLADAEQSSLPIDVDLIASVKGVRRREGLFDFAGRIYAEDDGQLVMDLNTGHNTNRKRFTCAHELMHTAFPEFAEEKRYRLDNTVESNPINREEEYLCDLGAAALLMPADLLTGRYPIDKGLESIETLSKEAEVSLEAAGNRIVELSQEPAVFMVFEFGHKPADRPALRRGEDVAKRVRLCYARCSGVDAYLPRFKSASDNSVIARAHSRSSTQRGLETLPGAEEAGDFEVEARCYGPDKRQRVLAVARPV